MFQMQSGPRHFAGSPLKPSRPFAAAACATSCTALVLLVASFAVNSQAQAQAQPQPQPQSQMQQARPASDLRLDPLNAQASVPPQVHASAFTQYRRLTDVPVGSWRDANDTVTRIGGWRVYAREAAQPASPPASVPASGASAPGMKPAEPAKAAPMTGDKDPRSGHKMN